jgi:integrase
LEAAPGVKYKAALSVAYGAGLRVSEVVSLKVSDIDSKRMMLRVKQGKGGKDSLNFLDNSLKLIAAIRRKLSSKLSAREEDLVRRVALPVRPLLYLQWRCSGGLAFTTCLHPLRWPEKRKCNSIAWRERVGPPRSSIHCSSI